jgi:putative transposase
MAQAVWRERQNCTGAHCWARGYAVSTVGYELEKVKRYIREQEVEEQAGLWGMLGVPVW